MGDLDGGLEVFRAHPRTAARRGIRLWDCGWAELISKHYRDVSEILNRSHVKQEQEQRRENLIRGPCSVPVSPQKTRALGLLPSKRAPHWPYEVLRGRKGKREKEGK